MAVALHVADGAQQQLEMVVVVCEVHFVVVGNQQRGVVVKVEEAAVFFVDLVQVARREEVQRADAVAGNQTPLCRFVAGLQVDDEVGQGHVGHDFVFDFPKQVLFVCLLVVVQDDGDEDLVFFQQEVGHHAAVARFFGVDDVDGFRAAHQEMQFCRQAMVGGVLVEQVEKRVGFGAFRQVEGVEIFGQPAGKGGFAAADRAFNDDVLVVHMFSRYLWLVGCGVF